MWRSGPDTPDHHSVPRTTVRLIGSRSTSLKLEITSCVLCKSGIDIPRPILAYRVHTKGSTTLRLHPPVNCSAPPATMAEKEDEALQEVLTHSAFPSTRVSFQLKINTSQRLKSALWFSIGKIVDEETLKLGMNATPQFIGALTEMVWTQIGTFLPFQIMGLRVVELMPALCCREYESRSGTVLQVSWPDQMKGRVGIKGLITCGYRHGGRQTISVDDVMLLSRRNEGLETVLRGFLDELKGPGKQKATRR